jgi:hypothetical protein
MVIQMKKVFDHVGFRATEKKADESWVENTRVWVTNPKEHPWAVEWLRYEPDSPCPRVLIENPHVAYRVDNLDEAAEGLSILLGPMIVDDFVRVGFYQSEDGSIVELMEYLRDEAEWFPKQHR